MNHRKPVLLLLILMTSLFTSAQIEAGFLMSKQFKGFGGTAMINMSFPVGESDYLTAEFGLSQYGNSDDMVVMIPLLAGYRYTFNRSGTGLYMEPNIGYSLGETDIPKEDANGQLIYNYSTNDYEYLKAKGVTTGINIGYLFPVTEGWLKAQWNICFRYSRNFSELQSNTFSLRLTHAFQLGRRRE